MSKIGKKPILIPNEIKLTQGDGSLSIEGPKGKRNYILPSCIKAIFKKDSLVLVRRWDDKEAKAFQGMARAQINNIMEGLKDGFSKELEIIGVGYRAQVIGKNLVLHLRFSHPVNFAIPEGIVIETPKPTQIIVKGIDKQKVGQTAARIRSIFKPEPYKGKGIRYVGEYVRRKAGKAVV